MRMTMRRRTRNRRSSRSSQTIRQINIKITGRSLQSTRQLEGQDLRPSHWLKGRNSLKQWMLNWMCAGPWSGTRGPYYIDLLSSLMHTWHQLIRHKKSGSSLAAVNSATVWLQVWEETCSSERFVKFSNSLAARLEKPIETSWGKTPARQWCHCQSCHHPDW